MSVTPLKQLAASMALLTLATAAWGQYVWVDDKGTKQFSDMPPPASVPKNRILKQPGKSFSQTESEPAPAAADDNAAKTPPTLAEKNAEFNKRRTEQAEKEKIS